MLHRIDRAWLRRSHASCWRSCVLGNGKGIAQRQRKIHDTKTLSSATKHENKAKQNEVKRTKRMANGERQKKEKGKEIANVHIRKANE